MRWIGAVLAWAVGSLVVLGGGGGLTSGARDARPNGPTDAGPLPAPNATAVALSVDPPRWWTLPGAATEFDAVWSGAPPGCILAPAWYRWSLTGSVVGGTIAPTSGATTNLTAAASASTTFGVALRAAAVVTCEGRSTSVVRAAASNVSVDATLTIGNVSLDPNPIAPNGTTTLYGRLAGGTPPYLVRVGWGDGRVAWANVSSPGAFQLTHRFAAGAFAPSVLVTDADGLTANATAAEAIVVSASLAVGLDPSSYVAEVGVPVTIRTEVVHPPDAFSWAISCAGTAYAAAMAAEADPELNCTFAQAGPDRVDVEVTAGGFAIENASAALTELVEPPLRVVVRPPDAPAELGAPADVGVAVDGGVAPFTVRWQFVGNRSSGEREELADGTSFVPVFPSAAGTDRIAVTVADALGVVSANSTLNLTVAPNLAASAAASGAVAPNATELELAGAVEAGAAPFEWAVVPSYVPVGGSNLTGAIAGSGEFAWNGTFAEEGAVALAVEVVDAAGTAWNATVIVRPVPQLALLAAVRAAGPGMISVGVTVTGGVPPLSAWVNSSAGTTWNGTLAQDGSATWIVPIAGAGNVTITITVVDRLGASATSTARTALASTTPPGVAPAPGSSGSPFLAEVACGVAVALAGWIVVARRRRRPTAAAPLPPDPTEVLRGIIAPADGVDRATVELLAEEAGVPFEAARLALDRLIVQGRVMSEAGSDGEEILAWTPTEAP